VLAPHEFHGEMAGPISCPCCGKPDKVGVAGWCDYLKPFNTLDGKVYIYSRNYRYVAVSCSYYLLFTCTGARDVIHFIVYWCSPCYPPRSVPFDHRAVPVLICIDASLLQVQPVPREGPFQGAQATEQAVCVCAMPIGDQCTSVPVYQCTSVPVYQCTSVPVYQCTSVPVYPCTRVPVYQCTNVPVYPFSAQPAQLPQLPQLI
jgi:hypothetical protein